MSESRERLAIVLGILFFGAMFYRLVTNPPSWHRDENQVRTVVDVNEPNEVGGEGGIGSDGNDDR